MAGKKSFTEEEGKELFSLGKNINAIPHMNCILVPNVPTMLSELSSLENLQWKTLYVLDT